MCLRLRDDLRGFALCRCNDAVGFGEVIGEIDSGEVAKNGTGLSGFDDGRHAAPSFAPQGALHPRVYDGRT